VQLAAPFHFKKYGGLPLNILYRFSGLMPAVWSLTGFLFRMKKFSKENDHQQENNYLSKKAELKFLCDIVVLPFRF
jgi:hypothetical protein